MLRSWIKPLVFVLCLAPLALLALRLAGGNLGPNPLEELTRQTGEWTLRLLLVTLAVTPLRRLLGWNRIIALRRMLGLFAFFYATVHLLTYVWFDQGFLWAEIGADILQRPFITVGMLAFVLLLPLALTSTNGMMRRLGRRWVQLHRSVYLIGVLGVLHFLWLVKADLQRPLVYAALLLILLGARVLLRAPAASARRRAAAAPRS